MNAEVYFIPFFIGIAFLCVPIGRMLFGDWDHPPSTAFSITFFVIGFTILIVSFAFVLKESEEIDKQNTIYYNNLKSSIKNMNCKDLGNYIINNADNYTLSSHQIIELAHGIYGVNCK